MDDLLPTSALKERGWTDSLIKKFLGEPDEKRENPHYRSAAPMRMYNPDRVQSVEATDDFLEAYAKAIARSKTGKIIAERKATELVEKAKLLTIAVTRLPIDQLRQEAIKSYNDSHWYSACATEDSNLSFLARIMVNYIRHSLTEYDRNLEELAGKIGVQEAIDVIRRRIYTEITETYPEFTTECDRQLYTKTGRGL